jgi:hypothetical protein
MLSRINQPTPTYVWEDIGYLNPINICHIDKFCIQILE